MRANRSIVNFFARLAIPLLLAASPLRLYSQTTPDLNAAIAASISNDSAPPGAVPSNGKSPSALLLPGASHALYIKVQVHDDAKIRNLKPGEVVKGHLANSVFSGSQEVFPAASRITMTVQGMQRCRRPDTDHWPWVARIFMPRHQNCPTFEAARVHLDGDKEVSLQLSLISVSREKQVRAKPRSKKHSGASPDPSSQELTANGAQQETPVVPSAVPAGRKAAAVGLTYTFEGAGWAPDSATGGPFSRDPDSLPAIPPGTPARVILLGSLSASKNHPGDLFRARVIEPVRVGDSIVLPEGSILEGHVAKIARPRSLSRSGSLLLLFDRLVPLEAPPTPLSASITGARLDQFSHTSIDPEGVMQGDHPGKVWLLLNLGATAGVAKVVDDTEQLIIEAIVSTATDASTAGTARIVASCASGLFMLTRHGRDVVLPQFTELDIAFNRSVNAPLPQARLTSGLRDAAEAQK